MLKVSNENSSILFDCYHAPILIVFNIPKHLHQNKNLATQQWCIPTSQRPHTSSNSLYNNKMTILNFSFNVGGHAANGCRSIKKRKDHMARICWFIRSPYQTLTPFQLSSNIIMLETEGIEQSLQESISSYEQVVQKSPICAVHLRSCSSCLEESHNIAYQIKNCFDDLGLLRGISH